MRTDALPIWEEIALDAMSRAACGQPAGRAGRLRPGPGAGTAVGIVLPEETPEVLAFLLDLAQNLRGAIVLGKTSIDARLMGRGLFVTGPIGDDERGRVVDQYGLGRYLLPYRASHYWALECWRRERPLPAAYFDWSGANFREHAEDLSLQPSSENAAVFLRLAPWLTAGSRGAS